MRLRLLVVLLVLASGIASAGNASAAGVSLRWVAFGEDKVGAFANAAPNGQPDGHFTVTVDAPGDTVTGMELQATNAGGAPCCGQHWDTYSGGWWVLGVFRDGAQLNPADNVLADPVAGSATYEVYGQNSGFFVEGQHFRIDVQLSSGTAVAALTAVGSQASTPLAGSAPTAPTTPGTPVPPVTPGTPATPVTPTPTPPAAPVVPATGTKAKLTLQVATGSKVLARGGCSTLTARYGAELPAGASLAIERRVGTLWKPVARGATARVCSKTGGRIAYRATLRKGAKLVAQSAVATVVWR